MQPLWRLEGFVDLDVPESDQDPEVPEDGVAKAAVNKRELAIIRRSEKFCALDGVHTHERGPLSEGALDGEELVCPWHEGHP